MYGYTAIELAYFAGLFDGEGCICISETKKHNFIVSFTLSNTNFDVINWIEQHFGGNVTPIKKQKSYYKQGYLWSAHKNTLQLYLPHLVHYLRIKKPQALLLLKYFDKISIGNKPTRKQRIKMANDMHELNSHSDDIADRFASFDLEPEQKV